MKKFRKTKAVMAAILSAVMILLMVAPSLAQGVVIKGEPDGQNKTTVMEEHFYSGSLEPNFTSDTVEVKTDSYSMHFAGAYHFGSALVLTAYKLQDYNRLTFSIEMLQSNDGFVYLGFGGADEKATVSYYDFNLCVSKGVTAIYEMAGMESWTQVGSAPVSNVLIPGKTTDFGVTLERVSGNNYKVTFEILEDGEPIFTTDYGSTVRMENTDGYICMWGGLNEKFNLRNFKVYDSPKHLAYEDDFTNTSLTYGDEALGDSNWHINEARFTRDEIFISRNAGPEFKAPNDTITAKSPLVTCDDVSKPYEISFKAKIASLEKDSTYGLYLGAEEAGALDKATIIGVSTLDKEFASVNVIKNGKVVDYGENLIPISVLNIDDTSVDFEVTLYSDYTLGLTIGGIQFSFNNVKYDGLWGICNYSADGKSKAVVTLDEVKVVRNTYAPCTQPDLSNDFAGIKLTQDGFEEYYISDRTYYLGPGVALRPKSAFTTEPSLYFENAGSYSAFAPKGQYTDFILQFDLKMVSEGSNSKWFGVNFGKQAFASIADTSTSVYFEYYGWTGEPYTQMVSNLCSFDDGTKAKKIEGYHFYKDQETKYNFMIVAKNRTVYVYFKEDSEDISKLGICRAVIPNVNTAGYVSIFGANGLSFDIFNYKLTNIAPEATEDSAIALRESFDKETISDKLQTVGAAQVQEGAMRLSGGSLEMKNKSNYYIANFTILEANADMAVQFSNNKSVTLSKDLKKVTVKDGKKKKVFDVSGYNLSDYKNTQIQLILQHDSLSVAAKGVYDPHDKFSSPMVEYTFAKPVAAGMLSWGSDDALIDDISVYALDHSYQAASVGYDEDPNDTDFWVKKEPLTQANENATAEMSKGMKTVFIVLYALVGAVILTLFGVIITLAVKKRGKEQ